MILLKSGSEIPSDPQHLIFAGIKELDCLNNYLRWHSGLCTGCSVFTHVSMQREVLLNMEISAVGCNGVADKEVLSNIVSPSEVIR